MNIVSWFIIFSIIAQVGLVFVVLARDINKSSHKAFGVFGSLLALWSTTLFFFEQSTAGDATFWITLVYTISVFFVFSGLYFAKNFPSRTVREKHNYLTWLHIVFGVIMLYMLYFTDSFIVSTSTNELGHYVQLGWAYYIYGVWIIIFAIQLIHTIYLKGKVLSGIEKNQLNLMIFALLVLSFWVIVPDIILPLIFDYPYLFSTSAIGTGLFSAITAYSVLKYRLLGVRFILGNLLYYIIIAFFPYSVFFILVRLLEVQFGGIFNIASYIFSVPIALVFTFLFMRLNDHVKKILNKRLIYIKYNPLETINKLVKKTSVELDLDKISEWTINMTKRALDVSHLGIILIDEEKGEIKYSHWDHKEEEIKYSEVQGVLEYWEYKFEVGEKVGEKFKNEVLILEEIEMKRVNVSVEEFRYLKKIIKLMKSRSIEVILPLDKGRDIYGLMTLGEKNNLSAYALEEIEFLDSITANTSIAFGRALLYQEVEKFNQTLKHKIAKATEELRKKNKRLEEARRKERDMMDIMGHELRTPASVVKINADMLKMARKRIEKEDEESCTTFLTQLDKSLPRIKDAIENELRLINILLTSAKMEGNRLELHKDEVDILKLIDMGVHSQETDAEKKDLYLKYEKSENPQNFPTVYADQVRLQEVLYNLINNAVKYTKKGGVTVKPELTEDGKYVKVVIQDTGVGIPEEEISKLGRKFYRVGQYINQDNEDNLTNKKEDRPDIVRPGGTGLGLYVTFELIKAHNGKIDIKSEVGKGSIFTFTIPIYDPDKHEKKEEKQVKDVFTRLGLKNKGK